jgi:hypothetical protein
MKFTLTNGNDTIVNLPFYPNGPKWKTFISPATDKRFPRNNFEYRFIDNKKTTMVMRIKEIYSADVPDSKDSTIIVAQAFAQMLKEMKKKEKSSSHHRPAWELWRMDTNNVCSIIRTIWQPFP